MIPDTAGLAAGLLLDQFPYMRIGDGPRPLLIIPGAELNAASPGFLTQQAMRVGFRGFAREYSVYIVHRRRGLPPSASTATMGADYVPVLRAITAGKAPAHVVGFSTGGLIAQHLAAQAPALIERLVLAVTGARLSPEGRRIVEQWRALAQARDWSELNAEMSAVLVTSAASKRLVRGLMRVFGSLVAPPPLYPDDFVTTMNADLAHDTTTLLPTLPMPTLVLGGEIDPFFPAPLLRETAELLPNAQLIVYPDAGHGLTKTHKGRFERDVLSFLAARAPFAAHSAT
jgi:pimeloyl-ACP methyl ester carboxylesterase